MPLAPANQSQLVRSSQKDEYYRTFLRNNANEAFQTLAGSKRWLDWRREIELLSDLAYYGLTTFSGYQTLGEEYVNIVQVDPTQRQIPSWARRGLFVLCHAYFPYLLGKVLVCLENELEGGQESRSGVGRRQAASGLWSLESWLRRWMLRLVGLLSEPQRKACVPAVFVLQQSLTLLHRLHVALFYISGSFYHLSKRAAGISYLNNFRQRQRARQEWKLYRNLSPQRSQSLGSRVSRCILCLEERRHSTSTPCGHLFCWECITEWCNTKAECPLCREKFQPHRLVYLRNYN
ncbi:Peroxisome biogenesis factor 10 [Nibea albiflora]|uniref:Peroxisome biogenesis factor 10 n=1 Tax=Nibea albiflora TaxID=240163 RepID=A0ACB7EJN5_NIBAL|nr:Peroxisome biogenesis factor 10 [Nibea albiflora]